MSVSSDRFARAIAAIDAYHQKDPNTDTHEGRVIPKELLYAQRMTDRLSQFADVEDEAVELAARCQHIGRWEIPREKYPMDKKGYLQWRNEEKFHHARIAEGILSACGYDAELIQRVRNMLLKKELQSNPHSQLLEDVACLVFIDHYLDEFAAKHDDEKVLDILAKTMKKMSLRARQEVNAVTHSRRINALITRTTAV